MIAESVSVLWGCTENCVTFFSSAPVHSPVQVFSSILKTHFREYRGPRRLTDYCQICCNFDDEVVPQLNKLLAATRVQLQTLCPTYFKEWDSFAETQDYPLRPALHCNDFEHFVKHHDRRTACRQHRGTNFPCGQASAPGVRQCKDKLALQECEIARGVDLRAMDKMVSSYNFHRASNDHQKPCIDEMLQSPRHGRVTILSDFAELMTLPLLAKQTGDSFFGTARKELSIFGSVIVEHIAQSTPAAPRIIKTCCIFVSEILDHTSTRAKILIEKALGCRRSSLPMTGLDLIGDCAGHFRSFETMHFALVDLVQAHSCEVCLHYGVEKHLKHECDRVFGWWRTGLKRLMDDKANILETNQLQHAMQAYFDRARQMDGTAPMVKVMLEDSEVPANCRKLICPDFRISRTYCMSSNPRKHGYLGVSLKNHVYSSRPASVPINIAGVDTQPGPSTWRRGYYGKGADAWNVKPEPVGPHDECMGS